MIWGSGGSKSRLTLLSGGCGASWPDERWKIARRCGAKHISKSKCKKKNTTHCRTTFESWDRWSKKCTPLWREAHFEVKMLKAPGVRTTFGGSDVASLHYTTGHYTTLHSSTLHCTTLHSSTLHYPLNYITPHYITPHYITLNDTAPQIDR